MSDETDPAAPAGDAQERGAPGPADDPTERSRWRPVFRLFSDMDDEIARVYADNGIDGPQADLGA